MQGGAGQGVHMPKLLQERGGKKGMWSEWSGVAAAMPEH